MLKRIITLLAAVLILSACAAPPSEAQKQGVSENPAVENSAEDASASLKPAAEAPASVNPATETSSPNKPAAETSVFEEPASRQADTGAILTAASDKLSDTAISGITAEFSVVNVWEQSGSYYSQWLCVIKNNSASAIKSWNVSKEFPEGTKLSDSWNGEYTFNANILTIGNVSYNGEIAKGGSTEIGFIVFSPVEIKKDETRTENVTSSAGEASSGSGSSGTASSGNASSDNPSSGNPSSMPENAPPIKVPQRTPKTSGKSDWLFAEGNKLYDEDGQEVWITGLNWFGYNTGTNTFDGLWSANADELLASIANRGFNLIRIPFSAELILNWSNGEFPKANYNQATNSHFNDKNSLEIFDYIVDTCDLLGLKIMIDIHSAKTDAMGHMKPMWYDGDITEADYMNALAWMAKRYKDDDTIIAYDIKNEPHGKPGESPRAIWNDSADADNWKHIAEKAALRVLNENPNALIVIEGIEIYPKDINKNGDYSSKNDGDYYFNWWGGNLRGVKDFPVDLGEYSNKIVYSPHDYGPAVYRQPWFYEGYNYNTLYEDCWRDNWMFIYEDETAPLLIGEWGGFLTEPNLTWMTHMRTLISNYRLNHTFWCLNANSGDTGGLVEHDFTTWDEKKYEFVKPVLWQKDGKFVGLCHDTPLGENGIALSEY
ncbi:MAG: cellulase family glycosylhydrolase [Clostridiales bacterium]|jgi:hypothetical protein|nr:cellulase family glycosylhydrolase [Clostridiales bacterium]